MDTCYAVNNLMLYIDSLDKNFYCPLKTNRLVDDTFSKEKSNCVELHSGHFICPLLHYFHYTFSNAKLFI